MGGIMVDRGDNSWGVCRLHMKHRGVPFVFIVCVTSVQYFYRGLQFAFFLLP